MAGISGSAGERVALVTPKRAESPVSDVPDSLRRWTKIELHPSGEEIGHQGVFIWHMNEVDAGHHLEQFATDVRRGPDPLRCHIEFASISLGIGDKFDEGFDRQ